MASFKGHIGTRNLAGEGSAGPSGAGRHLNLDAIFCPLRCSSFPLKADITPLQVCDFFVSALKGKAKAHFYDRSQQIYMTLRGSESCYELRVRELRAGSAIIETYIFDRSGDPLDRFGYTDWSPRLLSAADFTRRYHQFAELQICPADRMLSITEELTPVRVISRKSDVTFGVVNFIAVDRPGVLGVGMRYRSGQIKPEFFRTSSHFEVTMKLGDLVARIGARRDLLPGFSDSAIPILVGHVVKSSNHRLIRSIHIGGEGYGWRPLFHGALSLGAGRPRVVLPPESASS